MSFSGVEGITYGSVETSVTMEFIGHGSLSFALVGLFDTTRARVFISTASLWEFVMAGLSKAFASLELSKVQAVPRAA